MSGLMRGLDEIVLLIGAIGFILLVVFVSLCITIYKIASKKTGRKELAIAIGKKAAKRITFFLIFMLIGNYAHDVFLRNHVSHCRTEKSDDDDGLYKAEICDASSPITNYGYRLRIYSAADKSLLAERTYLTFGDFDLLWGRKGVWYGNHDDHITLPPTWYDRLLAKLP